MLSSVFLCKNQPSFWKRDAFTYDFFYSASGQFYLRLCHFDHSYLSNQMHMCIVPGYSSLEAFWKMRIAIPKSPAYYRVSLCRVRCRSVSNCWSSIFKRHKYSIIFNFWARASQNSRLNLEHREISKILRRLYIALRTTRKSRISDTFKG